MEKYRIILPCNGEEEEKELKRVVEGVEGAEITFDNIKGFCGLQTVADILVNAKEILYVVGAIASIISLQDRRVTILGDDDKKKKTNIKVENLEEYFNNILDDDFK